MTFTIEQIRKYLESRDSYGDVVYFLSEENILRANEQPKEFNEDE